MPLQSLTPQQLKDLSEMHPVWRKFWVAFFQAPKNMQDFSMSEEAFARIEDIFIKRHRLELETQASTAARITWDVFFGIIPLKSFIQELVEQVPLSVEQATEIAQEVNQAIFQPMKIGLMEVHRLKPTNGFPPSIAPVESEPNPQSELSTAPPPVSDTPVPEDIVQRGEIAPIPQNDSNPPAVTQLDNVYTPVEPPPVPPESLPLASDVHPLQPSPEMPPPPGQPSQDQENAEAAHRREELLARLRNHVSDYETYSHEPPSTNVSVEGTIEPRNETIQATPSEPLGDEPRIETHVTEAETPALLVAPEEEVPDLSITPPTLGESKLPKKNGTTGTLTALPFDRAPSTSLRISQDKPLAWNGKTIDLTKIPPRREANKSKGIGVEHNGVKYVRLAKSKDGFWYEV